MSSEQTSFFLARRCSSFDFGYSDFGDDDFLDASLVAFGIPTGCETLGVPVDDILLSDASVTAPCKPTPHLKPSTSACDLTACGPIINDSRPAVKVETATKPATKPSVAQQESQSRLLLPPLDNAPARYVNAKQYKCILRRRAQRAKTQQDVKNNNSGKSYRHESRHKHAVRRQRGAGGRFLPSPKVKIEESGGSGGHEEGLHIKQQQGVEMVRVFCNSLLNNKWKTEEQ